MMLTKTKSDGSIRINKTTKVTGKGQTYFVNRYLTHSRKDDAEGDRINGE